MTSYNSTTNKKPSMSYDVNYKWFEEKILSDFFQCEMYFMTRDSGDKSMELLPEFLDKII